MTDTRIIQLCELLAALGAYIPEDEDAQRVYEAIELLCEDLAG